MAWGVRKFEPDSIFIEGGMSGTSAEAVFAAFFVSWFMLLGCGPSNSSDPDGGGSETSDGQVSADAGDSVSDADEDGVPDARDNCPELANTAQMNSDGDAFGDACDCDPNDADVEAYLITENALTEDVGLFAAAPGFSSSSWSYDGGYRQTNLADDADDAAYLLTEEALEDVLVEVTVASTDIMDFGTNDFRQLFVVARASGTADSYSAFACGVELVEGLTPTQKTSVVELGGSPEAVTTDAKQRADREALSEGEEFSLRMELRGSTLTCRATIKDVVTVAQATDIPERAGSLGFHTRETRALFKNLKVCRFP